MVRDLPTPWYKRASVWAGFAGPWRVGFWMTFWDSLYPTAVPLDRQVVGQFPGHASKLSTIGLR